MNMSEDRELKQPPCPEELRVLPVVSVTTHGPRLKPADIPRVSSRLDWRDRLGHWKARWGIGRKSYTVDPGLYALGAPDERSPVVVSANYRFSFDLLRRDMEGLDAWILSLDTGGINVWCAAGKGTFGTEELVSRVASTGLGEIVSHRTLILPQLGAPGIAAHEVKEHSGFKVRYGPVRSRDLPSYLEAGMKADAGMRRVTFTFRERLVLIPMELLPALRWSLPALALLWLLGGWGGWGYSLGALRANGLNLTAAFLGAVAAGAVAAPLLLPWLPGRAFSLKGALTGLLWAVLFITLFSDKLPGAFPSRAWESAVWLLALPSLSAFLALNFTGSSTITSLSGVRKEFRYAAPLQAAGALSGLLLWITGHFLTGGS
jgi:acetyl-CoA decarbonylase/synthase complex subunit gamma